MSAYLHLLKNPLNPTERESFEVDPGTQIIEWLQEHYPDGFNMPIRVFVNAREIAVEDTDYVLQEEDIVAILVSPAEPVTLTTVLVINLIGLAVGLAMQLLFPPKTPGSRERENDPVYDIGATSNEARLGGNIPVVFGTVVTTPDFASVPYSFYSQTENNDMYVDQLMCLGVGEFDEVTLSDIRFGDTPANNMPAGTVKFQQFQLSGGTGNIKAHLGKWANIQKELWKDQWGGDEFLFAEHMYSAPEITDWEFNSDVTTETSSSGTIAMVFANAAGVNTLKIPSTTRVSSGKQITISGTASGNNTGTWYVTHAVPDYTETADSEGVYPSTVLTLYGLAVTPETTTGSIVGDVQTSNATAGPYVSSPVGQPVQRMYFDFTAPQGLYRARTSGQLEYLGSNASEPKFKIRLQEIDSSNNLVAGGIDFTHTITFNGNSQTPVRRTFMISAGMGAFVTGKRWQVTVSADYDFSTSQKIQNKCVWSGMKAQIDHTGESLYQDVTLLCVRIKATNGISSSAQTQMKVNCSRRYKLFDGSVGVSSNPIDVVNDIYTDETWGIGRPATEIDTAAFTGLRTLWGLTNVDKPDFNAVYISQTTVWEALESALAMAVARPAIDNGLLTIVADKKKPIPSYLFNESNTQEGSFEANYTLDVEGDYDSIEVEYRDPITFNQAYEVYPATDFSGKATAKHQRMTYFGVTSKAYAAQLARLAWNRRTYQRNTARFKVEMEGMIPLVGDRISLASPITRWGVSGRVVGVRDPASAKPTLILDKNLIWTDNPRTITVTQSDGTISKAVSIVRGASDNEVVLQALFDKDLDLSLQQEPASYSISADQGKPRQMTITKITHDGSVSFTIDAMQYEIDASNEHVLFEGAPKHLVLDNTGSPL